MSQTPEKKDERASHTPGPWTVERRYDGSRTVAIMRDCVHERIGLHVEAAHDWVGGSSVETLFANAQVIAAAPELLAAGREWADMSKPAREEWMNDTAYQAAGAAWDRLTAAIAKAEGRPTPARERKGTEV